MSFSGIGRGAARSISLGGKSKKSKLTRGELLKAARDKREARARARRLEQCAGVLQALFRGKLVRRNTRAEFLLSWDKKTQDIDKLQKLIKKQISLPLAQLLPLLREFNYAFDPSDVRPANVRRGCTMAKHMIKHLEGTKPQERLVDTAYFLKSESMFCRHRCQASFFLSHAMANLWTQLRNAGASGPGGRPDSSVCETLIRSADVILNLGNVDIAQGPGGPQSEWMPAAFYRLRFLQHFVCGPAIFGDWSIPKIFAAFSSLTPEPEPEVAARQSVEHQVLDILMRPLTEYTSNSNPMERAQRAASHPHTDDGHALAVAQIKQYVMASAGPAAANFTLQVLQSENAGNAIFLVDTVSSQSVNISMQPHQRLNILRNILVALAATVASNQEAERPRQGNNGDQDAIVPIKWNRVLDLVQQFIHALPANALLGDAGLAPAAEDDSSSDEEDDAASDKQYSSADRFSNHMLEEVQDSCPFHSNPRAKKSRLGQQRSVRYPNSHMRWTQLVASARFDTERFGAIEQLGVFGRESFMRAVKVSIFSEGSSDVVPTMFHLGETYFQLLLCTLRHGAGSSRTHLLSAHSAAPSATKRPGSAGGASKSATSAKPSITDAGLRDRLLQVLSAKNGPSGTKIGDPFFVTLWRALRRKIQPAKFHDHLVSAMRKSSEPNSSATSNTLPRCCIVVFMSFLSALGRCSDHQFHTLQEPFHVQEVREMVAVLRDVLHHLVWGQQSMARLNWMEKLMASVVSRLFNQLYSRNCRRRFIPDAAWHWPPQNTQSGESRARLSFAAFPQVVPFKTRARLYSAELDALHQSALHSHRIQLTVARDSIYEDAMDGFQQVFNGRSRSEISTLLRGGMRIAFKDQHGRMEMGVDGGGLFKEFVDQLTQRIFDPSYGFFRTTPGERQLYPSPASDILSADHLNHFTFMGQMLGVAMFNKISVEPIFANFFLKQVLGQQSEIDDLHSMDPELYSHLMTLYTASDDEVDDVDIYFEVAQERMGSVASVALVPGGHSLKVSPSNVGLYAQKLAQFKLHKEIAPQCRAFLRGLRLLIPERMLKIFSPQELQTLISGTDAPLDVADLRQNTSVDRRGFPEDRSDEFMGWFWDLLQSLEVEHQQNFLRFVTSCPRPPLLGFASLYPKFGIVLLSSTGDTMLPMAGTCYNLLKLPVYSTKEMLRDKLVTAISAKAGFEMS